MSCFFKKCRLLPASRGARIRIILSFTAAFRGLTTSHRSSALRAYTASYDASTCDCSQGSCFAVTAKILIPPPSCKQGSQNKDFSYAANSNLFGQVV